MRLTLMVSSLGRFALAQQPSPIDTLDPRMSPRAFVSASVRRQKHLRSNTASSGEIHDLGFLAEDVRESASSVARMH